MASTTSETNVFSTSKSLVGSLSRLQNGKSVGKIDYKAFTDSLTTKVLDLDVNPMDVILWRAACYFEDANKFICGYDCIRYRYSQKAKYKKKTGKLISKIGPHHSFLYGLYLPVRTTLFKIYAINSDQKPRKTLILECASLQDDKGYITFDQPIPLRKLSHELMFEYSFDTDLFRINDNLNRLVAPVFFCGLGPGEFDLYPLELADPVQIGPMTLRKIPESDENLWELV